MTGAPAAQAHSRRADIQGLRAIAVLLVVVYHASTHAPGGFTGVDVFFAISGYVITGMLLREVESGRTNVLPRFYARRIKRLFPALALMVSVVALLAVAANQFAAQLPAMKTGLAASLFSANAYLIALPNGYFDVGTRYDPFLHTWSLAVEEQFYVLFPAILLLAWRLRRRWALAAIGAITAVSFALCIVLSYSSSGGAQRFAFYGSPTRAWEFGLGAILAIWAPRLPRIAAEACAAVGVCAVLVGAHVLQGTAHFPGLSALIPVTGTLLAIAGAGSTASRLLSIRPLTWLGDRSYSWYLWHWPLIVDARLWSSSVWAPRLAAVASLVVAWASYRWVENPIRYSRRIVSRRVLALAAACVGVTAACCGALAVGHNELKHVSGMRAWLRSQSFHVDHVRGCDSIPQPRSALCVWPATPSRGTVTLVGDSNAGQFTEPVVAAAHRIGVTVEVDDAVGCPFVDLRLVTGDSAADRSCEAHVKTVLNRIARRHPKLVVIANRADEYIANASDGVAPLDGGSPQYGEDGKSSLWRSGLASLVQQIRAAGSRILLVRPVPYLPISPENCPTLRILASSCGAYSEPRSQVEEALASVTLDQRQALGSSGALLDLEGALCSPTRCSSMRGGTYLYRDDYHLSVRGALMVEGQFEHAMRSALD